MSKIIILGIIFKLSYNKNRHLICTYVIKFMTLTSLCLWWYVFLYCKK